MAVTPTTSKYCCLVVQQMLNDIVGENTPFNIVPETNGMFEAVNSAQNTSGFEQVQTESRQGKGLPSAGNRKVDIEYAVRQCNTVNQVAPNLCDVQTVQGDDLLYSQVDVQEISSTGFRLGKEEFRQLCESPNERQARAITNRLHDLMQDINDRMIAKFFAGVGNYFNPVTVPPTVPVNSNTNPKTLLMFNALYQNNALALSPLKRDYRKNGFKGMPITVGGDLMQDWMNNGPVFVGDNDGKDSTRTSAPPFWYDYRVDDVIADGDQHLLSWVPGYVQMLQWFQFEPGTVYEELKPNFQETVLDMGGFKFDFTVKYNECDHVWDLTFTKYWDLFKVPNEAFNEDCGQFSNGCLNWLLDCGDLDCNYAKL